MRWIDIRSDDFPKAVEACNGVCVIPIGCVEAHGKHLPLGCDTIASAEYARRAAEIAPVCVFRRCTSVKRAAQENSLVRSSFPSP